METLEQRNAELTTEVAKSLSSRELDAASQLESAQKIHDLLSKLKDVEEENVRLQGCIVDLKHKCEVLEKNVQEEWAKVEDLQSKLMAETQKSETLSLDCKTLSAELEKERFCMKESMVKLESDWKLLHEENERTKAELNLKAKSLTETETQQANLTNFISQLMQVVLDVTGAKLKTPDVLSCSESDVAEFIKACQKLSTERWSNVHNRLETMEKREATLTAERELMQRTVDAIINTLPDKVSCMYFLFFLCFNFFSFSFTVNDDMVCVIITICLVFCHHYLAEGGFRIGLCSTYVLDMFLIRMIFSVKYFRQNNLSVSSFSAFGILFFSFSSSYTDLIW